MWLNTYILYTYKCHLSSNLRNGNRKISVINIKTNAWIQYCKTPEKMPSEMDSPLKEMYITMDLERGMVKKAF